LPMAKSHAKSTRETRIFFFSLYFLFYLRLETKKYIEEFFINLFNLVLK